MPPRTCNCAARPKIAPTKSPSNGPTSKPRGHLPQYKETSIDTQFLDQLFGEGLGYQLKTTSPESWQLEHKFTVPEVGTADAALGEFPKSAVPTVVVELKGSRTDLDRDRSNGRTAVQQCWDYLNALPGCEWGIVSNFATIRLYHHEKGTLAYEEFSLQELRIRDRFDEFYCLFERGGLLRSRLGQEPRALELLRRTAARQKEVGEDLYKSYQSQRLRLIEHLNLVEKKSLDESIRIAQKLLDRIIFIAFCEKRGLLAEECINRAARDSGDFFGHRNPRLAEIPRPVSRGRPRAANSSASKRATTAGCSLPIRRSKPSNSTTFPGPKAFAPSPATTFPRK